jgi:hypothetical protein
MDLTTKEVIVLLLISINDDKMLLDDYKFEDYYEIIDSLINKGLIYSQSGNSYIITKTAKTRISNHILKEKNLPEYISKYSFPEAFDKFFSTASPNAINTLLLSWLNSNKFTGLNPVTLKRLVEIANNEINNINNKTKVNLLIKK